MANSYIKPLYEQIYGDHFEYHGFGKRMKMQKCIYLAEQFGLYVGDYDFSWYKHGPYSQRLQDDMHEENSKKLSNVVYSEFAQKVIDRIKEMVIKSRTPGFVYTEEQWMECLASIHYLKRLYRGNKSKSTSELMTRKPHLANIQLNEEAYDLV